MPAKEDNALIMKILTLNLNLLTGNKGRYNFSSELVTSAIP